MLDEVHNSVQEHYQHKKHESVLSTLSMHQDLTLYSRIVFLMKTIMFNLSYHQQFKGLLSDNYALKLLYQQD